jgi:hypothetical protein
MMWQFDICSFFYPNGVLFCLIEDGQLGIKKGGSTQTFFSKQLSKFIRKIIFMGPGFGDQFEISASSPT